MSVHGIETNEDLPTIIWLWREREKDANLM